VRRVRGAAFVAMATLASNDVVERAHCLGPCRAEGVHGLRRVKRAPSRELEAEDLAAFDDPGHHGTPNQRLAAAQFGFDVADQYQKQGHILTSQEFYELFMKVYPTIVAPDA